MNLVKTEPKVKQKKPKKFNLKSFVIATLRRGTYRYQPRNDALKAAKTARNQYVCAHCPSIKRHPRKNVQIDHIDPIVRLTGFTTWDDYINRMYCPMEGFQILCLKHHEIKTEHEKKIRKEYKLLEKQNAEKYGDTE